MKTVLNHIRNYARTALPHIGIVLSLMFFVFLIVDRYNRAMAFVNNDITKALLLVAAFVALALHRLYTPITVRLSKLAHAVVSDLLILGSMLSMTFVFIYFLDKEVMVINTSTVKILITLFSVCLLLLSVATAFLHRKYIDKIV